MGGGQSALCSAQDAQHWRLVVRERGAVSLLFISAGLPFLLMLLVVGMEISQFLGAREALQAIVDQESHASLQRGYTEDEVSRRVTSRLGARASQIAVSRIVSDRGNGSSSVTVVGSFRGVVSEVFGDLVGATGGSITFEVSGSARRSRLGALIILDRVSSPGAALCEDAHLALRSDFVARLTRSLRESGARLVLVGVAPGAGEEALTILQAAFEVDGILRCGQSGESDLDGVRGVAAVRDPQTGPIDLAYEAVKRFATVVNRDEIETGALILVSSANEARTEPGVATLSLLESSLGAFGKPTIAVALAEGATVGSDPYPARPGGASGLVRYISATDGDIQKPELVSAIVGHIHGRTFLSR